MTAQWVLHLRDDNLISVSLAGVRRERVGSPLFQLREQRGEPVAILSILRNPVNPVHSL
jgi:hypothetical protein